MGPIPSSEWEAKKIGIADPPIKTKEGHVPNVVFSCGQVEMDEKILVYYCGADTVIAAAEILKKDIVFT